jgi:hypothetical protein
VPIKCETAIHIKNDKFPWGLKMTPLLSTHFLNDRGKDSDKIALFALVQER